MSYLVYNEVTLPNASDKEIADYYSQGYLLSRKNPGYLYQTRSTRLDLAKFIPSSENRRILKKYHWEIKTKELPLAIADYDWRLAKLAKDFYQTKFQAVQFSANKTKLLLTASDYEFNLLFSLENFAYCIAYQQSDFLHYCYPFYDLNLAQTNNLGMYFMLQAILWSQIHGKSYIYLGGLTRPADKYKLQFAGLEYWENNRWENDLELAKNLIAE